MFNYDKKNGKNGKYGLIEKSLGDPSLDKVSLGGGKASLDNVKWGEPNYPKFGGKKK